MAYMVPEKLPYNASMGEKKTFALLQNLPDSCIVYYEPIISNRYPDFIVILPTVGVLVVEVKGWRHTEIEKINNEEASVNGVNEKHPRRQAREYMFKLMDVCKQSGLCGDLIHESGQYEGKFKLPFAHMVVLSNIDGEQLKYAPAGDLTPFFPPENTITRDRLAEMLNREISEKQLVEYFRGFFELQWPVKLSQQQINELRAVIHPEITIERPPYEIFPSTPEIDEGPETPSSSFSDSRSLKILDLEQEKEARRIGSGHRLLWGVAGSGKTVLLISRAKYLAQENPEARILVTCYNLTLAAYLKHAFEDYPTVEAINFHALAKRLWKISYKKDESNEDFAMRLLDEVQSRNIKPIYDMILVDEAQDFDPAWFQSLLSLLKEREEGDLVIVGDGTQGIYKSRKITWKSLGIQAQGRTTYFRKNYRNSKEIIALAANFNHAPVGDNNANNEEESSVEAVCLNPESAVRSSGIKPVLVSGSQGEIGDAILKIVSDLLSGKFNGHNLNSPLLPGEIAILYPSLTNGIKRTFFFILNGLKDKGVPVLWANTPFLKTLVCSPDLKLMPIYSAKGLQYKAVILLGADMMPRNDEANTPESDERLMYVALTRPEDYLVITDCGAPSEFIDRFKKAKDEDIVETLN